MNKIKCVILYHKRSSLNQSYSTSTVCYKEIHSSKRKSSALREKNETCRVSRDTKFPHRPTTSIWHLLSRRISKTLVMLHSTKTIQAPAYTSFSVASHQHLSLPMASRTRWSSTSWATTSSVCYQRGCTTCCIWRDLKKCFRAEVTCWLYAALWVLCLKFLFKVCYFSHMICNKSNDESRHL